MKEKKTGSGLTFLGAVAIIATIIRLIWQVVHFWRKTPVAVEKEIQP